MALINCPNCNSPVSDEAKFCIKCGFNFESVKRCPDCGAYCSLSAQVCNQCGKPFNSGNANNSGSTNNNSGSRLHTVIIIILAILVIGMAAYILISALKGGKYEGKGYSTPEDAITAYAEGMKAGDFTKMRSTFAIESYTENAGPEGLIERFRSYMPFVSASFPVLPGDSDFTKEVSIERRNANVIVQISTQYVNWAKNRDIDIAETFPLGDDDPEELIEEIFDTDKLNNYPEIEIGEIIDNDVLSDLYDSETNNESLKIQSKAIGAESYRSVSLGLTIDGRDYILMADAVKYNDKWHIYSLSGNIGALVGLDHTAYGLCPAKDLY